MMCINALWKRKQLLVEIIWITLTAVFSWLTIKTVTFDRLIIQVYLHCDVLVCDTDPASRCSQGCVTRAKRSAAGQPRGSSSKPHTISNGPMSDQAAAGSSSMGELHSERVALITLSEQCYDWLLNNKAHLLPPPPPPKKKKIIIIIMLI